MDDDIHVLHDEAAFLEAGADGIYGQIAARRLDADESLLLACRDQAPITDERGAGFVLVERDTAVNAQDVHAERVPTFQGIFTLIR